MLKRKRLFVSSVFASRIFFFCDGKIVFYVWWCSNCYLQTDLLISWLSFNEISCSYRYESSIMNKKCSCFVIAKYCLKKRANYCLREAGILFVHFHFVISRRVKYIESRWRLALVTMPTDKDAFYFTRDWLAYGFCSLLLGRGCCSPYIA